MCVKPLKGWCVGLNPETGKKKIMITDWSVDHVEKLSTGSWISVKEFENMSDGLVSKPSPEDVSSLAVSIVRDYITIPCGHCIECLKARGQEWTNRCLLEYEYAKQSSYFVSLTYRDEDLPFTYYDDPETGEAFPAYTLSKTHMQLFLKRLRKHFFGNEKGTLRYYLAGEYGPTTLRPHYHLLLFDVPFADLVPTPHPNYFVSQLLDRLWPYGFHQISPMEPDCIAYTCHYVTAKLNTDNYDLYDEHNMERPFALMSRRPSIGRRYFDEHPELFEDLLSNPDPQIYLTTSQGGIKMSLPSYFWYLYEKEGGNVEFVKDFRQARMKDKLSAQLADTDLNYTAILDARERNQMFKYSNLLRRDVL
ncbi:replication initiator protein [Microvirus mar21]|uniref:Replication initiator protein n=1 Tax=Microvirus mar21 TaxID=2851154 RepID=A0A8F5RCP7_9VIRU|nr:replication initiator protein [Microvirus mar21]